MRSFDQLGEQIRTGLERGSTPEVLSEQKQRLLAASAAETSLHPSPPRRILRLALATGLGVSLLAAGLIWIWALQRAPSCTSDSGSPVRSGDWFSTGSTQLVSLTFSERSQVQVKPSTNLWVADLASDRVRLSLQTGRLDLQVQPDTGITWRIQGGPYQVEVIGTQFSVEWNPQEQGLDVSVERGAVKVRGGQLGDREVIVRAGETLHSRLGDTRSIRLSNSKNLPKNLLPTEPPLNDLSLAEVPAPPTAPDSPPRPKLKLEPKPPPTELALLQQAEPVPRPQANWRDLAEQGRFNEALRLIEAEGVDEVLAGRSATDLLILADAARLSKRAALSRKALLAVRERFPNSALKSQAAIRLGRLDAAEGAFEQSAKWLARYVQEAPHGRWVGEARGRLLEAWMELRRPDEAKRAADEYLRYHPEGPYRATAARILGVMLPR